MDKELLLACVVQRWDLIAAMKSKTLKVKIDQVDLQEFTYDALVIDPYWDDLYNPKEKKKINKKNENKHYNDSL